MTKADFELLAEALKAQRPADHWNANKKVQWRLDCRAVAHIFLNSNRTCTPQQFLLACGIEEEVEKC